VINDFKRDSKGELGLFDYKGFLEP
jgi:hypothetical protein